MPEESLERRALTPQDAPALLDFYNHLSPATIRLFRPLGLSTTLEICQHIASESVSTPPARVDVVACDQMGIIGWAFIEGVSTNHPNLGIAVADDFQGRGIGTSLLTQIVVWAQENNLPAIYLMVVQDNQRAIHLYERYGFVTYDEEFDTKDQLHYFHMVARLQAQGTKAKENKDRGNHLQTDGFIL